MEQTAERSLRPLFWALIRIGFALNIGLFGILQIDLLPAFLGYWTVGEQMRAFPEYPWPRWYGKALGLAALASLLAWFPLVQAAMPAWALTAVSLTQTALNAAVYYHVAGLLIFLSGAHGRLDLAENGRRFRRVFLIPYVLLSVISVLRGGVMDFWYALALIFQMALIVYAANCDRALTPREE